MVKNRLYLLILLPLLLSSCGYNTLVSLDEEVKAGWSEVLNQYKRRADLTPNLVKVVKAYAAHEKETLEAVINARARATSVTASPELVEDEAAFRKFQAAQGELSGALSRLMVVAEQYPNLKADAQFRDLSASLEGTENRITVARGRYIKLVSQYNSEVRKFPNNLTSGLFGFKTKANFTVDNEAQISEPPAVDL